MIYGEFSGIKKSDKSFNLWDLSFTYVLLIVVCSFAF